MIAFHIFTPRQSTMNAKSPKMQPVAPLATGYPSENIGAFKKPGLCASSCFNCRRNMRRMAGVSAKMIILKMKRARELAWRALHEAFYAIAMRFLYYRLLRPYRSFITTFSPLIYFKVDGYYYWWWLGMICNDDSGFSSEAQNIDNFYSWYWRVDDATRSYIFEHFERASYW